MFPPDTMAKERYYYKCDENSKCGHALKKYWHKAVMAAKRADDYARKYGATEYESPVQFFAGGVDYLIFGDKTPDPRVWRKKITTGDGIDLYEPNCMYHTDVLVLPVDHFHPSNTWNRVYTKRHLSWEEARPMKTLQQWAKIAHIEITGYMQEDVKAVNERLSGYTFVSFLEFYGDDAIPATGKTDSPAWLRRAIRAEQDRQVLPVVEVFPLYALLDMRPKEEGRTVTMSVTPSFFVHKDAFFICTEHPCHADGLHPISEGTYVYHQNMASRQKH